MPRYLGPTRLRFATIRTCDQLGCHQEARRSGLCVWHDPKATQEERDAADRALEPAHRRRLGGRAA